MKNALIAFLSLLICVACYKSEKTSKLNLDEILSETNYTPTTLPENTTKFWIAEGEIESDTVLIISQGGSSQYLKFLEKRKSSYRCIEGYKNYLKIYLHQANTYTPEMFNYKTSFTLNMAKVEVEYTSEILFRAIKYFKDQNKVVIVAGHSYGHLL